MSISAVMRKERSPGEAFDVILLDEEVYPNKKRDAEVYLTLILRLNRDSNPIRSIRLLIEGTIRNLEDLSEQLLDEKLMKETFDFYELLSFADREASIEGNSFSVPKISQLRLRTVKDNSEIHVHFEDQLQSGQNYGFYLYFEIPQFANARGMLRKSWDCGVDIYFWDVSGLDYNEIMPIKAGNISLGIPPGYVTHIITPGIIQQSRLEDGTTWLRWEVSDLKPRYEGLRIFASYLRPIPWWLPYVSLALAIAGIILAVLFKFILR